jgi:IS5 family transposase
MKKHGKNHYGYKNHVNVDRMHKLVRRYHVSDAAQHDSQAVDHLLMRGNTGSGVWADAAYRSEEMEAKLRDRKLKSHIHRKGKRGKPLTDQAKGSNRTKSTVRVRVEHIFGAQANDMGGTLERTIGLVRAKAKIGMRNLAYNMRRPCRPCRASSSDHQPQHVAQACLAIRDHTGDSGWSWHVRDHAPRAHVEAHGLALAGAVS